MPGLFDPLDFSGITLRNRIVMSPMCQYQAEGDGRPTSWHHTHYVSRAVGGVGLVLSEMTDVEPRGRITQGCLGLWNEEQAEQFSSIAEACHREGARFGIQIAHAGRKSTLTDDMVAPSAVPFSADRPIPRALVHAEIKEIVQAFVRSAKLAASSGVDAVELHAAHGYLLHQFLSPISNRREDEYGDLLKFPLEVVREIRHAVPDLPLIIRVSAIEYQDGGYGFEHCLQFMKGCIELGVSGFDVSTGGNGPFRPEGYPGVHLRYASAVRQKFNIPTIVVGSMHHPALAEYAVREELVDLVAVGRGLLRSPYWPYEAARELGGGFKLGGEYSKGV